MSRRGLQTGLWRRLQRAVKAQQGCCATQGCEGEPARVVRPANYTDLALCVACFDRRRFGAPVRPQSWRDAGARAARLVRGGGPPVKPSPTPAAPLSPLDGEEWAREVAAIEAQTGRPTHECEAWVVFYVADAVAKRAHALADKWLDAGEPAAARASLAAANQWAGLAAEAARVAAHGQ